MRVRAAALVVCVAMLAAACAASGDDNADDGTGADGGVGGCEITISITPALPHVGEIVSATATFRYDDGVREVEWLMSTPGLDAGPSNMDLSPTSDPLTVSFVANTAGAYRLSASGSAGGETCEGASVDLNVTDASASFARYRLRYTPEVAQPAPPQDDPLPLLIVGSSSIVLPTRTLDAGWAVSGTVAGPGASPVSGYLLAQSILGGRPLELFASALGQFARRLPNGRYDVLVVPYDGAVPPARFAPRDVTDLNQGFVLDAGDALGGLVRGPAPGLTPFANVRLRVGSGDLPATVATTAAGGTFTARWRRAAGPLVLDVVPQAGTGQVELSLPASAAVTPAAGAQLTVTYASAAPVTLSALAVDAAGTPMPGARVTFVAEPADLPAGTLQVDGGAAMPLVPRAREVVVAGAGGVLSAVLPAARYVVIVEPPSVDGSTAFSSDGPAARSLDLRGGAPAPPPSLASAARVAYAVNVSTTGGGVLIAKARVVATSLGLAGAHAGVVASALTDDAGQATLALAPGMPYSLRVEPPRDRPLERVVVPVLPDASAGQAQAVALRPAVVVKGQLVFPSGAPQAGIRVEAICETCSPNGPDGSRSVAETSTEAGGKFVLYLPPVPME